MFHGNNRSVSDTIANLIHLLLYSCLYIGHLAHRWIRTDIFSPAAFFFSFLYRQLTNKEPLTPSHVAISCPQLSPSTDHSSPNIEREAAIVDLVRNLFHAGVRHISIHDPIQPIHARRFCKRLCDSHIQSGIQFSFFESVRSEPLFIGVSNITQVQTSQSEIILNPPVKAESLFEQIISYLRGCSLADVNARYCSNFQRYGMDPTETNPLRRQNKNPVRERENRGEAKTVANFDENVDTQLTFIHQQGRMSVVRAAQKIAQQRLSNYRETTIQEIIRILDGDKEASVLPSEPDVLIVFPLTGAPSVPILHGFPIWQLRLTQMFFAQTPPNRTSLYTILNMITKSAITPKRFGR